MAPPAPPPEPLRPMPCWLAKGLLPGRGAPGRCMPCWLANGLLPGRGMPGRGPPGRGAAESPEAAGAAGAAGVAEPDAAEASAGFCGAAAAGAAGAAAAGVAGADAAARSAEAGAGADAGAAAGAAGAAGAGVEVRPAEGPGAGAPGRAPPGRGPDDDDFGAAEDEPAAGADEPPEAAPAPALISASLRRRATGGSMLDEGPLTNWPISLSVARATLLSTPSSAATSCTRGFAATILLSGWPTQTGQAVSSGRVSFRAAHQLSLMVHGAVQPVL